MILDLFAGPGGWDVGARHLGLDPYGVENDAAAQETRRAAGLVTLWGDVRTLPDMEHLDCDGLIASPPCQTFSMAGKGAGRVALEQVLLGVKRVATGEPIPYDEYDDIRTGLVLEPLRYALELEPEWIAWEQVPTVQPVWDACAEVLREDGYHVWTGHLHAEQYGVPQTRKRSVLIASRSRAVGRPMPTHSRFYSRSPAKLDEGVAKWVSMAEALGWSDRVLTQWRGAGMTERHGTRPDRTMDQPAFTMAGLGGSGSGPLRWTSGMLSAGGNNTAGQILRTPGMPSATLTGKGTAYWQSVEREISEGGKPGYEPGWPHRRPAPTILSGHNRSTSELPNGSAKGSVRVTVEEAACLQSFPDGYPWQGTRTKQFQQVGNAIPPLLALHVLSEATGIAMSSNVTPDERESTDG